MKTKKVVTNLRIDEQNWLQIKAIAAEVGMSANEYVNVLIERFSTARELGITDPKTSHKAPIWKLWRIAIKRGEGKGLTAEDKEIYE